MKVALLGENYYPTLGGIQEHIFNLAKQLRSDGHDARVITGLPECSVWRGPQDEDWVMRVGRARRFGVMGTSTTFTLGPRISANLKRILRQESFDLVHVHGPDDFGLPVLLYRHYNGPIVATLHSPMNDDSWLRRLVAPYYRRVLARTNAVISVSEAARAAMSRYAPVNGPIVPNGVNVAAMAAGRPVFRKPDDGPVILMLGRLEPRNGPDLMFDALPEILRRWPTARLLVAGEERPDGTTRHEAMVPPAVRDRVTFLGAVFEERADVYASADLCVLPARSGTFSIVILEALAAGALVVATPFVSSWREEAHWEPVRVADEISAAGVARSVLAALEENKCQNGAASKRRTDGNEVVTRFDWSVVSRTIMDVYEEAMAPTPNAITSSGLTGTSVWPGA